METTPSSNWRAAGEPDPHAGHYDGERANLCMGNLTDDELANAAFLNYDRRPTVEQLVAGTHPSPIMYMTAVKDRIRWLSRALEKALAARSEPERVMCLRCGFVTHLQDGETPAETTHKAYMQRTAHLRFDGSSEGER